MKYVEQVVIEKNVETIITKRYIMHEGSYKLDSITETEVSANNGNLKSIIVNGKKIKDVKDINLVEEPSYEALTYLPWVEGSRFLSDSVNVKYRYSTSPIITGQVSYGSRSATIDSSRADSVELFTYYVGHVDKMRAAEFQAATLGLSGIMKKLSSIVLGGGTVSVAVVISVAKSLGYGIAVATAERVYTAIHHYTVAIRQADILIRNN